MRAAANPGLHGVRKDVRAVSAVFTSASLFKIQFIGSLKMLPSMFQRIALNYLSQLLILIHVSFLLMYRSFLSKPCYYCLSG